MLRAYQVPHAPLVVVDDSYGAVQAASGFLRCPVSVIPCHPSGVPDVPVRAVRDISSLRQLSSVVRQLASGSRRTAFAVQSQPDSDLDLRLTIRRHGHWGTRATIGYRSTAEPNETDPSLSLPAGTSDVAVAVRSLCVHDAVEDDSRARGILARRLPALLQHLSELLDDHTEVIRLHGDVATTPTGHLVLTAARAVTDGTSPLETALWREVRTV